VTPDPASILGISTGFAIGALLQYREKRDAQTLARIFWMALAWAALFLLVSPVRTWLGPAVSGIRQIHDLSPLLFAGSFALWIVAAYLGEDEPGQARLAALGTAGIGLVAGGALIGVNGGPWAPVGLAILLAAATLILAILVYRLFLQQPVTRKG